LKPAPRPEGKIIFAPLAPFDVLFFIIREVSTETVALQDVSKGQKNEECFSNISMMDISKTADVICCVLDFNK